MIPWLKQNWLALCGLVISAFAFILSYKKFRHDTRPALILRYRPQGQEVEIENVGQAMAVDVKLPLLERLRRPTATLLVYDTLRPNEKKPISASNWPDALEIDVDKNTLLPLDESVRMIPDGQSVRPKGIRVAYYLMVREGKPIIILRFRAAEGSRTFVRLFSTVKNSGLMPCYRLLRNSLGAFILEKCYARNAELAPPSKLPPFDKNAANSKEPLR